MANIILYNSNEIIPSAGGVERVAKIMYDGFIANGHNVAILFYYKISGEDKPNNQFKLPSTNTIYFIKDFIHRHNTHIVINLCGLYNSTSATLIKACKNTDIKIISVFHNSFDSLLWTTRHINKLMKLSFTRKLLRITLALIERLPIYKGGRYIYNHSDKIILLSDSYISEYKYFVYSDDNKVISIHNPMPFKTKNINWDEKDNCVLFVGRLDYQKGLDKLLKIWSKINNPNWTLNIIGDGPLKEDLKSLARQLGIANNTHFLGHRNPTAYYQKAKIFAMTSLYEGFPMVLIESMAYGCVPIVFDSYAAAKEIMYNNGYLIDAFDEDSFQRKLSLIMSHPDNLRPRSMNCIDYSRQFSPNIIIKQWETLIAELLKPL